VTSRSQLKKLALLRRREAEALCSAKLYDGARYLAGYVLEVALKARICRVLDLEYPDSGDLRRVYATHDLDQLLMLSGLSRKLELQKDTLLLESWVNAAAWRPEQRYAAPGITTFEDERRCLADVDKVLAWIRKYW
jgi:HEPN domain-containing protein